MKEPKEAGYKFYKSIKLIQTTRIHNVKRELNRVQEHTNLKEREIYKNHIS